MPRIEQWSVCYRDSDPYAAPETKRPSIQGKVYGQLGRADGTGIATNYVVKVDGSVVTTKSGSIYVLGEPDPKYLEWCVERGIEFDPKNPIKVKT